MNIFDNAEKSHNIMNIKKSPDVGNVKKMNTTNNGFKRFRDWKISTKIAVCFASLLLLSFSILGFIAYSGISEALKAKINSFSVTNAEDAANLVQKTLINYIANVEAVAARPEIRTMDWKKQEAALKSEASRLDYLRLNIIDLKGSARSSDGNLADLSQRDYFKNAIAGKSNISDPLMSKFDGKMVMVVAVPIKGEDEKIIGALSATVDYNTLSKLVSEFNLGTSGYAFVINSKGTTIAHPDPELVSNSYNSFNEVESDPSLKSIVAIQKAMLSGKSGYGEYEYKDETCFMSYAPISGTEWSIGLTIEKSQLFGTVTTMGQQIVLMIVIFMILNVLLSLVLVKSLIHKPIHKLLGVTEKLAVGDVDVSTENDSYDEIGLLMNSFERIIQNTREQAYAVEKISKGDLNTKVEIRSDRDILSKSMMLVIDTLSNLEEETSKLTAASLEGNLKERGKPDKFSGIYKEIVDGINNTLDAVIAPVLEEQAVLSEVSKGNLNVSVVGEYKGDHAIIKNALNETINMLSGYINDINKTLSQLSQGDLDIDIQGEYIGDFVGIKNSLKKIISSLNEVLGSIRNAAEQVASGARQIADSSQVLASGASGQASSIEQLTATINDISEKTKLNANKSNDAKTLTAIGSDAAKKGNSSMKEMLTSIKEINESSNSISKIIKVIDDIAFQTNILALNAAVEAARAGQYGKGFAVVADEVRNLAEKSALAAKETASLIEDSIKKVEVGTEIANETASDLNKIVEGTNKSAELLKEIFEISIGQEASIGQINLAINQVSQVVHTNSATSEETAASSEELSSQADMLMEMVGRFKLRNSLNSSLLEKKKEEKHKIHF